MTGRELQLAAERRWGESWVIALAAAFSVSTRQVYRWVKEGKLMPRVESHARLLFPSMSAGDAE